MTSSCQAYVKEKSLEAADSCGLSCVEEIEGAVLHELSPCGKLLRDLDELVELCN